MRMKLPALLAAAWVLVSVGWLAACEGDGTRSETPVASEEGDAEVGRRLVDEYGCTACHRVPGVSRTDVWVGPPLDAWSRRSFIAGTLPNSASNLAIWLADPDDVRPGTAMPDLQLADGEIADVVAYLFTLD